MKNIAKIERKGKQIKLITKINTIHTRNNYLAQIKYTITLK